ncbi:MAG: hypothetical protein AAGA47_01815 [Pseudomonadota bacterium]
MLARISTHLGETRVSNAVDWLVLGVGVIMLTTAIVGTVVTPAMAIQAESDLANARESAAL